MRLADLFRLAFANLRRNRTRSLLTLVGVAVGAAALLALLSYGAGLQQNARSEFGALGLYNTLRVTSQPNPVTSLGDFSFQETAPQHRDTARVVPLTDSLLRVIGQMDGVLAAYPEVTFPAQVKAGGRQVMANAEAVPMAFQEIASYRPEAGRFFEAAEDSALLLAPSMARRLGFDDPQRAVGDTLTLVTATLDLSKLAAAPMAFGQGLGALPIREETYRLRVAGLLDEENQPMSGFTRVVLPLGVAQGMQKVTFFSTLDLLLRGASGSSEGYAAARVQTVEGADQDAVREKIEKSGVFVTSFRDQFRQLERLFVIMDLALGIVGLIALLVATVGIANTMAMNVRERYREIGIMKAVGGDEGDVQKLFVAESAALGFLGGLAGLMLGYGVVRLLDWGVGFYLYRHGFPPVSVFYTTAAMALGILGVALVVALLAGVLPARRAARIEPLEALRST